jgi:hypothetical protein
MHLGSGSENRRAKTRIYFDTPYYKKGRDYHYGYYAH